MQLANHIHLQGFHVIDNFLPSESYQALCEMGKNLYTRCQFKPANIGRQLNKAHNITIRNDSIFWIEKGVNQAVNAYFNQLDTICSTLNESLFLGLHDYEAHFAVYKSNGFYKKHVDQFATTKDRRISCVYYLNNEWRPEFGGELRLYTTKDTFLTDISPIGNRFVCFSSDMPHEVCLSRRERYSIATWLKVRPLR